MVPTQVDLYQYHSEGLHGVRTAGLLFLGVNTTLFPQVTGLAATGNLSLVRAMAGVMSTEARAFNTRIDALWSNIDFVGGLLQLY